MNTEALLARLRADERYDAAVLRMGEADYGCEERPDGAPEMVWLLAVTANGREKSMEGPAGAADRLGMAEGVVLRMEELGG